MPVDRHFTAAILLALCAALAWAVPGYAATTEGAGLHTESAVQGMGGQEPGHEPRSSFRSVGPLAAESAEPGWGFQMTLIASKWDQIGILIIGGLLLGWLHYIRRRRV